MFSINKFFSNFFTLLILLLHLGCFTSSSHRHHQRRRVSPSQLKNKLLSHPMKATLVSSLKRLFSSPPSSSSSMHYIVPHPAVPSPSFSTRSNRPIKIPLSSAHNHASDYNINPCPVCGQIFQTPTLLQHHQSTKHAVSEIADGENIVRIIFNMGWPEKSKSRPTIHRILKIHNGPQTLARFEEYRELVKSRAAAATIKNMTSSDERCVADGNELLRFCCTTLTCDLDSSICSQNYCSVCGIIMSGFSHKLDGISTMPTSWRAHGTLPEDMEEEFSFMHVKRALLVCRVIAGRVGCGTCLADKENPGFDSLVGGFEDELLVFNPRAVLPCFVIVYKPRV